MSKPEQSRLKELSKKLKAESAEPKPAPQAAETAAQRVEANAPHGEKGDHVKVTVTLPPEVYKIIADEASRRKMAKEKNAQLSAVIREAVVAYLSK